MFPLENEYKSLLPEMHTGLTKRPALFLLCNKVKIKMLRHYSNCVEVLNAVSINGALNTQT